MLPKTPSFLSNLATQPTSLQWRSQFQQSQLVSQISSILLQRKHWIQLLKSSHLSSNLTPDHIFQILQNTQDHPQISLDFFNWSKTNLPFKPHLKSHLKIVQILLQSNLHEPANRLFKDVRIQSEQIQISSILNTSIQVCKGRVPAYSVGDNHQEGSGTCNCTEWLVRKKRTAAFLQEDLLNLIEDWKVHHSACSLVIYSILIAMESTPLALIKSISSLRIEAIQPLDGNFP
eukprot:TRINITY_DN17692_c0_g1_i2.p1 TRINITY_DN17692_c0_g1~~TRINITY_DN17692_c0_g1_i2.p1  ORF type:complete len:232 (+),score=23.42 TRINITY_DN17692_c0_g1_i2:136-831(+)